MNRPGSALPATMEQASLIAPWARFSRWRALFTVNPRASLAQPYSLSHIRVCLQDTAWGSKTYIRPAPLAIPDIDLSVAGSKGDSPPEGFARSPARIRHVAGGASWNP